MVNKFLLSVFYTGITSFSVIVTNLQLFGKMSKLFSTFFSTRAFLGKLFFERRGCAINNSKTAIIIIALFRIIITFAFHNDIK